MLGQRIAARRRARVGRRIALSVAVLTLLSGCGQAVSTTQPGQPNPDTPAASMTSSVSTHGKSSNAETGVGSILTMGKMYTLRQETDQGYAQTAKLTVYPALRGTRQLELSALWSRLGGSGEMPCQDVDVANDMLVGTFVVTDSAAYALGTLQITNDSTGFSPPPLTWQFTSTRASSLYYENTAMGLGYSNGADCDGMSTGGQIVKPNWQGNIWGPVPIVFAYNNVFTPKSPAGDPRVVSGAPVQMNLGSPILDQSGKSVRGIPVVLAAP